MTKKEVAKICVNIRKATNAWRNETADDFEETIGVWYECLKDMPYDMAEKALVDYLKRNTYPPAVADIYKPYKEYLEQQKAMRLEYNNIYYTAIAHYPCYKDSPEEREEFDRITGRSLSRATKLSNKLIDYVRSCELSDEYIPPLEEWLKEIDSID